MAEVSKTVSIKSLNLLRVRDSRTSDAIRTLLITSSTPRNWGPYFVHASCRTIGPDCLIFGFPPSFVCLSFLVLELSSLAPVCDVWLVCRPPKNMVGASDQPCHKGRSDIIIIGALHAAEFSARLTWWICTQVEEL